MYLDRLLTVAAIWRFKDSEVAEIAPEVITRREHQYGPGYTIVLASDYYIDHITGGFMFPEHPFRNTRVGDKYRLHELLGTDPDWMKLVNWVKSGKRPPDEGSICLERDVCKDRWDSILE